MAELRNRIEQMSQREKVTVFGGAALAVIIVVYVTVWEPWQRSLTQLRQQVPVKQETLAWMRSQAERIAPVLNDPDRSRTQSGVPLLTLVEQSANRAAIRDVIRRMGPGESPTQVRVWLTDANFDQWLKWVETLRTQGVEVLAANISRGQDDKVTIRVTFERALGA